MAIVSVLIYLIIILSTLAVYFVQKRLNYWKDQGIPHDEPSLLTGNFQGLTTKRSVADCTREVYEKYKGSGPFCGFYFFQRPAALLLDMNLVKHVLIKDFSKFTDRGLFHNEKADPLTGHLFLLDGAKWKNLRHKLSPTFTSGKMKFMYPIITDVAENFVQVFAEMSEKSNIVEIKELLARFTTDIIGRCAFGVECNSLKDPNAEFRIMGRRSMIERRHGKWVNGFIQGFPSLARKLNIAMVKDEFTEFFIRIVRETVAYREQNNIKANDFLSILMELRDGEGKENKISMTLEEMAAQSFVFFLGGFETSSSTMGFSLYELAVHSDIQQKLREEINEVFDGEGKTTYEAIHDLPYLGKVISETLRKYPILPHLNRQALVDYVVPGHPKYVIKKGMPVVIPAFAMHRDPEIYPEPEKFDPERFDEDKVKQRETVEFLAFGDGPRNCIGMRFGLMQSRVGLAYLLRHFKFSVCEETKVPLVLDKRSFVLSSKDGIFLKVEKV
ncbi:cytochrome P450 6a9 isoform X1 [Stomoxys calcitrans]|uniref:cytochrome P450 6a9 isoform X1 n=1 Tax=Stomoxys calcitrans TaxID=35570 RepID=UPI0027E303C5|nr:cytochrome P450 6a9 isoform X1 [Stomoxys calcitrans]